MSKFLEFTESVRAKSDVVEIIGADAKLERSGSEWKCCSPLRTEKTPSFWVYPATQSWVDFGTGEGGDVFSYVQKRDACAFKDAVLVLARRAGIQAPWEEHSNDPLTAEALGYLERRNVQDMQTEAAEYYHHALPTRIREQILKGVYGFTDDTIDKLRIGWAPGAGSLAHYFREVKGYSHEACLRTGFFLDHTGELIDFFDRRIVFPYWHRGLVVYAIARRTEYTGDEDYERAKYKKLLTHSDKHPFVSKTVGNDWFYNEDCVGGRRLEELVITEGVTDCIAAMQAGLACLSPVTVRFREKDLPKLLRLTERVDRIVLCNDADVLADGRRPGEEGALQTATSLFQQKRDVRIASLPRPEGVAKVDLNEYAKQQGVAELRRVLDAALRYPEFLIQQLPERGLDPADLEDRLRPVCEVVASTSPLQREGYISKIARRFRLPKRTVAEMIASFDPPEPMLTDEQKRVEDAKRAIDAQKEERVRGRVLEDIGFYYTKSMTGAEEVISSFSLRCKQRISVDGQELLSCDILVDRGRTIEGFTFPRTAWTSRRDFIRALPSPDLQWTGTDDHVQGVLRLVTSAAVPTRKGTTNLGYHDGADGPRWVWPGPVISPSGFLEDADVVYVPNGSSLGARLAYEPTPHDELVALAKDALPALLRLNAPDVLLPILGWFFATPFKPKLQKLLGHFPILMVWGTQGSGKTSIVKEIFWPLLGVARRTEPYSCTETEFALMRQFACTDSVPVFLDEFKPRDMGKQRVDRLLRLLRRVYGGEVEERGRIDLSVATFNLLAPIVLAGESMPEGDPALLERMICVSPDKNYLGAHPEAQTEFRRLARMQLSRLAGPFVQWSMSRDTDEDLQRARAHTDLLIAKIQQAGRLPIRVYDNLLAMTFGLSMFSAWAEDLGVELPELDTAIACHTLTKNILEGEQANVKDAFDGFLEALSTYAHMGMLQEDTHYAMVDGKLNLHLPSCHEVYLSERRKTGREDDTNGPRALKRVAHEKLARGGYVKEVDKRVKLGEQLVRTVVIDMEAVPDVLDFERFPAKGNREWGGARGAHEAAGQGRWGWGAGNGPGEA